MIESEGDGSLLLVEYTDILPGDGANGDEFRALSDGEPVEFECGENGYGRPFACRVRPLG